MNNLIIYELNEVPLKVLNWFCNKYPNSALNHLKQHSRNYETYANDEGHLSPWITWPTVHRGINNQVHEISDFGQNLDKVDKDFPPVWNILLNKGIKVGLFGSLHSYPVPKNKDNLSFYVPDTFAAGSECFPKNLEKFQNFNLKMVQQNMRNVNSKILLKEGFNFLLNSPLLGIKIDTHFQIGSQLISEIKNKNRVVRRRSLQMRLAFDVFYKNLVKTEPQCSFFFTNHVASSLHRYWPGLFPEDYKIKKYDQEWMNQFSGEIEYAMFEVNRQIKHLIQFTKTRPHYKILVLSSMGQEAVQNTVSVNNQILIMNFCKFMKILGLETTDWKQLPSMAPQFSISINPDKILKFKEKIISLNVNGIQFRETNSDEVVDVSFSHISDNIFRLHLGILNADHLSVHFEGKSLNPNDVGIKNIDISDKAGSNAYHIPEGILLSYENNKKINNNVTKEIPTTQILPSILKNFNIERSDYMEKSFKL